MNNRIQFSNQELEQDENNLRNRVTSAVEDRVELYRRPHVDINEIGVLIADLRRK